MDPVHPVTGALAPMPSVWPGDADVLLATSSEINSVVSGFRFTWIMIHSRRLVVSHTYLMNNIMPNVVYTLNI